MSVTDVDEFIVKKPTHVQAVPDPGKSFGDMCPDAIVEWGWARNGEATPFDFKPKSNKKVWWRCNVFSCQHEWISTVCNRTAGRGCPMCVRRRRRLQTPKAGESFSDFHPRLATEWHPTKNGDLKPIDVMAGSTRMAWWLCSETYCQHEWVATPDGRSKSSNDCPACAGRVSPGAGHLAATHPELIIEWDYETNDGLTPDQVTLGSDQKIGWVCASGHRWIKRIADRTAGTGCQVCAGGITDTDTSNSLATRYPELAAEWDYHINDGLTPERVLAGTNKRVGWICAKCKHRWQTWVAHRVNGTGCPGCSKSAATVSHNLAALYPELAAEWDYEANGGLTPEHVAPSSGKKIAWRCGNDGCQRTWYAVPANRSRGAGCPSCAGGASKPETAMYEIAANWLSNTEQDVVAPVPWGKVNYSRLDVLGTMNGQQVVLEYDGSYWHRDRLDSDIEKTLALLEHDYLVVRIRECSHKHYAGPLTIDHPRFFEFEIDKVDELEECMKRVRKSVEASVANPVLPND